jgi:hypothetical protein
MFVKEPTGYGINNTYRYMCDQIKLSKQAKTILKGIFNNGVCKNKLPREFKRQERNKSEVRQRMTTL